MSTSNILLLTLLLFSVCLLQAEDKIEGQASIPYVETPLSEELLQSEASIPSDEAFDEFVGTETSTGFKYSWEMPLYREKYSHLRGVLWLEPANMFYLVSSFTHHRENDDQDNYSIVGYASLRPFVFDFGDYSIALGTSYINRYVEVSDFDPKIANADVNGLPAVVTANQVKTEAYQHAINFSALASMPNLSLQIVLDVGFGWSRLRETIDPIEIDVANGAQVIVLDEYQYKQHDQGIYAGITFLKTFNRDYFNYFRLFLYGAHRTLTTTRDSTAVVFVDGAPLGKINLENSEAILGVDLDPQQVDEYKLNFLAMQFEVRFCTIMTPLSENKGLGINGFFSVIYTEGELLQEDFYGVRYRYGGIIGIFEGVSLRVSFVDEEGSDRVDGIEATMTVRVSEIFRALVN